MDMIDLQIYLSQIKTFFDQNPEQLIKLIGDKDPDKFYDGVKKLAKKNMENGDDIQLTNKQMINLVVEINEYKKSNNINKTVEKYMQGKFSKMYLN
jgi:hypothetical protein